MSFELMKCIVGCVGSMNIAFPGASEVFAPVGRIHVIRVWQTLIVDKRK